MHLPLVHVVSICEAGCSPGGDSHDIRGVGIRRNAGLRTGSGQDNEHVSI